MYIIHHMACDVKLILFSVTDIDTDYQIGAKAQRITAAIAANAEKRIRHGLTRD